MKWLIAIACLALIGCKATQPPLPSQFAKPASAPRALLTRSVTLAFDAPSDASITGYRIYYRNEAGWTNNVDVGMATTNSVLLPPASYKLWAVSYNAAGVESVPSNEVSYTVSASGTAVIVLWTGPNVEGPWPVALTTNRISATNVQAYFNQTITLE